ncbi:MAG: TRAP transporter substrate-binding protein [Rhizobiaceae bacterium]|nr:TRAP transporter substrate-binding protein [Rhizobiaceae bacterium]
MIKQSLTALVMTLGLSNTTYAEPAKITMQSAFGSNLPSLGETGKYFAEKVTKTTGGEVTIKFEEPGAFVRLPEIFGAVSSGSLDAGYTASTYSSGINSAHYIFTGIPFGPKGSEFLSWIYNGGGLELWQELYARQNIYVLPCGLMPAEASGWFRKEIKTPEDLKGLKMRFGGLGGVVMKKLGVSVVVMGGGDVVPALERGVLDASEFATPEIDQKLGLDKVAKYYYFPGWHQPTALLEFIINMKVWKKLDESQQLTIKTACKDAVLTGFVKGMSNQSKPMKELEAKGVNIKIWSPEMIEAFRAASNEVVSEFSAKNKDFKRAYDSMSSFRNEMEYWRSRAYVD